MSKVSQSSQSQSYHPTIIGAAQIRLLERLCNACAVSGDESEVRAIVLEQIRPYVSEIKVDALGNILAVRQGQAAERLRVMVAAHMDEVGLMLTGDDEQGFFRFEVVGKVETSQLVGKPVRIGRDHLPGIIGAKPVHLVASDERNQSISTESLRIDVCPDNARKAKVGDWAVFATPFARLGPSLRAKALDDRLGVASLIELLRHAPPNIDLLAAFTVQEEIGLRGARVAAYALDPHLAIVLDSSPARDLPNLDGSEDAENTHYNTRLGAGPAIYIADKATLSDPRLVRHLVETAEALGIPYQIRQPGSGSNDAGAIHKQRAGVPTVSVSVPGRYPHTSAGICRLEDWKNTLALVLAALTRLTPAILSAAR